MIMKCNSALHWHAVLLHSSKLFSFYRCFHILKPLLNHIVKIPISSHQSYIELYLWSSLSFALTLFYSLHFARSISLHFGVYFFEDDWITPTEIAVTQILGHLPNPLGGNIQITPLFSAIHSGLLFLILWLQRLTLLLIVGNLQQFCLLIYLWLLCYRK